MGIIGYLNRAILKGKIDERVIAVFGEETDTQKRDQFCENVINIFEQFLVDCFAK